MPNEPSFPSDLLSMVAGLGRKAVDWLPEEPVTPPLTPLEPFYGAGQAPRLSLKDIGSFLTPQTPLDVGLAVLPGGITGRGAGRVLNRIRYIQDAGLGPRMWDRRAKAYLVPAIRDLKSGKEYLGRLGRELEHDELVAKYRLFGKRLGVPRKHLSRGYVNAKNGEWLTEEQAAAKLAEIDRSRRANVGSMIEGQRQLEGERLRRFLTSPFSRGSLEEFRRGGSTVGDATPRVERPSPQELVSEADKLTARISEILATFGHKIE